MSVLFAAGTVSRFAQAADLTEYVGFPCLTGLADLHNATGQSPALPGPASAPTLLWSSPGGCQIGLSKRTASTNGFVWRPQEFDVNDIALIVTGYKLEIPETYAWIWINADPTHWALLNTREWDRESI